MSPLVQKFHISFFTVFDSGDNVNARLGCGNEMIYVPQRAISLLCDSLPDAVHSLFNSFKLVFSCPPAAISIHNLQDESTSRLMKETESHYSYSKKFSKQKANQKSAYETEEVEELQRRKSGTKVRIKATEKRGGIWSDTYEKNRFVQSVRMSPMERIHNQHGIRF